MDVRIWQRAVIAIKRIFPRKRTRKWKNIAGRRANFAVLMVLILVLLQSVLIK